MNFLFDILQFFESVVFESLTTFSIENIQLSLLGM